jgi:peptidoglycan/LPS O-acetylase OafA/YrhL
MHFFFLDALRGVAAIAVLLQHIYQAVFGGGAPTHSYLAVSLFFALSGYVIAHAYESKMLSGLSLAGFLWRRVVRLFPLIVLSVLLAAAVQLWFSPDPDAMSPWDVARAVAYSVFLIPNFTAPGNALFPINGPMWSLFYEMVASVLFGLVFFRMRSRVLAAVALVSGLGFAYAIWRFHGAQFGWSRAMMGWSTLQAVFTFTAGMLAYRFSRVRLPSVPGGGLGLAAGVTLALIAVFVWPMDPHVARIDLVANLLLFPALVFLGGRVNVPAFNRLWAVLGGLSYPLYILSDPVLTALGFAMKAHPVWILPAALVLAPAVGWLALKAYDEPVRRWLTGLRIRRTVATAES